MASERVITFRVTVEQFERLQKAALDRGVSVSELIRGKLKKEIGK